MGCPCVGGTCLYEFEASLVYRVSSRTGLFTEKPKQKNPTKQKKNCELCVPVCVCVCIHTTHMWRSEGNLGAWLSPSKMFETGLSFVLSLCLLDWLALGISGILLLYANLLIGTQGLQLLPLGVQLSHGFWASKLRPSHLLCTLAHWGNSHAPKLHIFVVIVVVVVIVDLFQSGSLKERMLYHVQSFLQKFHFKIDKTQATVRTSYE